MRVFAHDRYTVPLPAGHRFPAGKYRLARERAERTPGLCVADAPRASQAELELAHDAGYLGRVEQGTLTRREQLALGLPWSPQLVERARRSVGATLEAARAALADGTAANLGGGTHHAFPGAARGYCVFNDVVVAARALRRASLVHRVLVVDLDVHQGDGTQHAFAGDDGAFTLGVNGFGNYPFRRVPGDLEVDLPDGTRDEPYLAELERALPEAIERSRPELCFYLAGADPYEGDRLGRLAVSRAGLAARDRAVRDLLGAAGIPVCLTLAGGYAEPIEETVEINLETLRTFAAA